MTKENKTKANNYKQQISELKQNIGQLMDQQKQRDFEFANLRKENTELRMRNINIQKYAQWNVKQIIFWILSLENQRFEKYTKQLRKEFISEGINGSDITEIDEFNLQKWGVQNFRDRKDLMKHIKTLSNYAPNNNGNGKGNDNVQNEGADYTDYH